MQGAAVRDVHSFIAGRWVPPGPDAALLADAATGQVIARAGGAPLEMDAAVAHARDRGGPALRQMTFHQRARMLKALALHLNERREALYDLSFHTGATARDHLFDVDGGIGTLFVYASKGRRELPDSRLLVDGPVERLGRQGRFLGQHVFTPRRGVAVHINAYNFPVWGMLEKLAPTLLAGVPAIVKPATQTCYVTELAVRMIVESGILPEGALQLVAGGAGDLLDHLGPQDMVAFTGSAATAGRLRAHPGLLSRAVRFTAEQDSLNATILGPDAVPGTPEFDLFVREVHREMTVKAGQKCTAIRRIIVPEALLEPAIGAITARLGKTVVGNPRHPDVGMGALVSRSQREDVLEKAALIGQEAVRVWGDPEALEPLDADPARGAFLPPMLYRLDDPDAAIGVHHTEAFGPVSTIMPCRDPGHAAEIAARGEGSLVVSVFTADPALARELVMEAGAWHGRIYVNNADSAAEATGHGAPMPHMVHGGPGRAGGGEELGGIRAVKHYMQRTAIQGSPDIIAGVTGRFVPGARQEEGPTHPFRRRFHELKPGETLKTARREITLADIEHFAAFTGDTFYAHMDEAAAARNPFFPGRVAHGYLLLSFAAGLFVDPDEGPVLANTGLDGLRFLKPVVPGDSIRVELTVKDKTPRTEEYGEVRWHVRLLDQDDEPVAEYDLLTMVAA